MRVASCGVRNFLKAELEEVHEKEILLVLVSKYSLRVKQPGGVFREIAWLQNNKNSHGHTRKTIVIC